MGDLQKSQPGFLGQVVPRIPAAAAEGHKVAQEDEELCHRRSGDAHRLQRIQLQMDHG